MKAEDTAVTLSAAAEQLHVLPQRVSQLLKTGVLEGPPVAEGRRAARNAPRVYADSLAQQVAARSSRPRPVRGRRLADIEAKLSSLSVELAELRQNTLDRERSARASALHMKATVDALHEQLMEQIAATEEMSVESALNQVRRQAAEQRVRAAETARAGISSAMTDLLGPAGVHDLGGG